MTCPLAHTHSRRIFLKHLGMIALTGTLGWSLAACDTGGMEGDGDEGRNTGGDPALNGIVATANKVTIDLSKVSRLRNAGGYLILINEDGHSVHVIVINVDGSTFKAFTSICTHQGCDVASYSSSTQRIICNCHGSEFDLNGNPVAGPAPSPLRSYPVTRSGDILTVTLS